MIAPLNWGLGHATRCVPLIDRCLTEGARVTLGGDGESLDWLRRRYPDLPTVELASLRLHYSRGESQTWALVRQLPHILGWIWRDHRLFVRLQREHHWDRVISDNRFGLWLPGEKESVEVVYMTHQLRIRLPKPFAVLEPLAQRVHARIINRYAECWVPDCAPAPGLAGDLSHPTDMSLYRIPIRYVGPLSRFSNLPLSPTGKREYKGGKGREVLLLSGLEPQRTRLREWVRVHYPDAEVIEGCTDDAYVAQRLCEAQTIIARSGYSTIMDLTALGLLDRAVLIPTPGQSEQEYLAEGMGRGAKLPQ